MKPEQYIYDIETYPNFFSIDVIRDSDGTHWYYEYSQYRNELSQILALLDHIRVSKAEMVGFNNIGFDYPVIHKIMMEGPAGITIDQIYEKAQMIFNAPHEGPGRWANQVWESDWIIPQVDLFLIHHFDNPARSTGLKALQFAMREHSIEDLPIEPGTVLTAEQAALMGEYNGHDTTVTRRFLKETQGMIAFRRDLCEKYPSNNWMNYNDTKIGKQFFIMKLEEAAPGACYYRDENNTKKIRQTKRPEGVLLEDLILPYIFFNDPELNRIKDWLGTQRVVETKGVFDGVTCISRGFEYVFGVGGIHGSVDNRVVLSDDEYMIVDLDVTSYYPSLAISNGLYPEHLSTVFCEIYTDMKRQRVELYPKKTHPTENAMLKLALNGVYGDSNNKYSPFSDPAYMLSITVNGQLLLCQLAEMLCDAIPELEMIQINTDGLTVRIPRSRYETLKRAHSVWEMMTGLDLEEAIYSRMWIRDVNNYIAEKDDGELKRKGAYRIMEDLDWHQDSSAMIVPMAVQAALVHGADYGEFIRWHYDPLDFAMRAKVRRSDRLELADHTVLQRITRYVVSKSGQSLWKIMPPLKGKTEPRRSAVTKGYLVTPCNRVEQIPLSDINHDYYIAEAKKLLKPFSQ